MNRRALLKAAPALALIGAAPTAAAQPDRTAALVAEWRLAADAFNAAVEKPGGADFDSPECLHWEERMDRLEAELKDTPLSGPEGTLALIEFGRRNHASSDGNWIDLPRWIVDKLQDQARAQMGGAA